MQENVNITTNVDAQLKNIEKRRRKHELKRMATAILNFPIYPKFNLNFKLGVSTSSNYFVITFNEIWIVVFDRSAIWSFKFAAFCFVLRRLPSFFFLKNKSRKINFIVLPLLTSEEKAEKRRACQQTEGK